MAMSEIYSGHLRDCDAKADRTLELRLGEPLSPDDSQKVEGWLLVDPGDRWGDKPLTAEELLEIGREAFEPLFHEPPIGPIPEYLRPHLSRHGCVAEYEDKLEELDRWKARKLDLWLKGKAGKRCAAGGRLFELRMQKGESSAPEKYWFELIEDRSQPTPA
jgi:hypothetical protein